MPLTKKDLQAFKTLMEVTIQEQVPSIVQQELREQIGNIPTKEESARDQDALMGELQNLREAVDIVTGYKDQIDDNTDRLDKIQSHLHLATT